MGPNIYQHSCRQASNAHPPAYLDVIDILQDGSKNDERTAPHGQHGEGHPVLIPKAQLLPDLMPKSDQYHLRGDLLFLLGGKRTNIGPGEGLSRLPLQIFLINQESPQDTLPRFVERKERRAASNSPPSNSADVINLSLPPVPRSRVSGRFLTLIDPKESRMESEG